jgi:hypothetical protein
MDWGEATCLNAVFMPESFQVLGVSAKINRTKKAHAKKSSLEEDGISGDPGFKASGGGEISCLPG